jgi:hypothetical protein
MGHEESTEPLEGESRPMSTSTSEERYSLGGAYIGVRVGPYKIANVDGKLYVGHENGEGGTFTEAQLLPYIKEFFREHF